MKYRSNVADDLRKTPSLTRKSDRIIQKKDDFLMSKS